MLDGREAIELAEASTMAKIIKQTDRYIVVDDLMDRTEYLALVGAIQDLRYDDPGSEWRKLWPLTDSPPLQSGYFRWSERPCGYGLDVAIENISSELFAARSTNFIGATWGDIAFRVYLHGRGSRLQCHSDSPLYAGAAVFYAHYEWRSYWGGELVFPDVDNKANHQPVIGDGPILNKGLRLMMEEKFCGEYVAPKPNRLVIIKGGVWHYTNPVDYAAGDNIRVSIATFLQKTDERVRAGDESFELGE